MSVRKVKEFCYLIILASGLCLMLSKCTFSRNVNKNNVSKDSSITVKADIKIDSTDKSVIQSITTVKADTVISVSKDTLEGSVAVDTSVHIIKSGTLEIKTKYNSQSKEEEVTVISSPKPIHVIFSKQTILDEHKDISVKTVKDTSSSKSVKTDNKHKDVAEKSAFNLPWYIWLLLFLLLVGWLLYEKYKPKL